MAQHLFRLGQLVRMTQRYPDTAGGAVYEIVRLMPETANGEFHYRVKATSGQERAVAESQLSSATEASAGAGSFAAAPA